MTALILDGRTLAQELRAAAQSDIAALSERLGCAPGLAVIQVLGDAASTRYVRSIEKLCAGVGARFSLVILPADAAQVQLEVTIDELNADLATDGILLQLPLPAHLHADAAIMRIDHRKDVRRRPPG